MNTAFSALLLDWLSWWAFLISLEWLVIYCLDPLLAAWQGRQEARRQLRKDIDRIDRDTYASINRIGIAYAAAQQLLRDEAALNRSDRQ